MLDELAADGGLDATARMDPKLITPLTSRRFVDVEERARSTH
jgi:hypothetical protein